MKGLVITTNNIMKLQDFDEPLYESLGKAVGGYLETVYPMGLEDPLAMIVNEDGIAMHLPVNPIASNLYRTLEHGHPIYGDVVIMKIGETEDGPDIVGLEVE